MKSTNKQNQNSKKLSSLVNTSTLKVRIEIIQMIIRLLRTAMVVKKMQNDIFHPENQVFTETVQFRHFLTEYCREEFKKFTTFLTSKKYRNWLVFG